MAHRAAADRTVTVHIPTGLVVDEASHAPKLRIPLGGGTTIAVCPVNYYRQPRMTVLTHPFTPHWQAELELGYTRIGDATRPVLRRHSGPLRVQKHLYPEGPEVCQHIIVHPGASPAGIGWTSASRSAPAPGRS